MHKTALNETRQNRGGAATIVLRCASMALLALPWQVKAQMAPMPQTIGSINPGEKAKVVGAIVSRKADTLLVRRENSNEIFVVTLTDQTKVESPSGLMNIDRKRQDITTLGPGLFLKAYGNGGASGNLVASRISFHKTALKVANQISAGEVDLREKIAANANDIAANKTNLAAARDSVEAAKARARDTLDAMHSRVSDLDEYDIKFNATVNFATGSAVLSDAAKAELDALVSNASSVRGYLVEVVGYTDKVGSDDLNQRLSERRTRAVVAYLAQERNVPLRRIVNPTGFGDTHPVSSNDTEEGRAQNRRVEVRVMVNRAVRSPD
jgi:OmpA-OmpF porin, OOP family